MEINDLIRYGLAVHLVSMVLFGLLLIFLIIRRPNHPTYDPVGDSDDAKTKNAQKYDRFESDKYIWKQRLKVTGALTAILISLFSIWSIVALNLEQRPNDENQITNPTGSQNSETPEK